MLGLPSLFKDCVKGPTDVQLLAAARYLQLIMGLIVSTDAGLLCVTCGWPGCGELGLFSERGGNLVVYLKHCIRGVYTVLSFAGM